MAVSSPLLEASIDGAHGVLLSIAGGSDLGLFEINEAAQLVSGAAAGDANIIFGTVIDDALGDEVRVTVIAAGFDEPVAESRKEAPPQPASRNQPPPRVAAPRPPLSSAPSVKAEPRFEPSPVRPVGSSPAGPATGAAQQAGPLTAFDAPPPAVTPIAAAEQGPALPPPLSRETTADGLRGDQQTGPVSIPRPASEPPAPPTPIAARVSEPVRRRPVVFEEQEEELDVPDFLK
jgi:cell division protein FtsZ